VCGRGKMFEDLSSDKSHEYFEKFVRKWNAGELESMYYECVGLSLTLLRLELRSKYFSSAVVAWRLR
jgi:hypothetical protein